MTRPFTVACSILVAITLILPICGHPQSTKKATPPTAKDLVGVWIGFDDDDLTFTRLELRANSTGYCSRVSPADTILHNYGVQVYRINKWTLSGSDMTFDLTPASANAGKVYLKGRFSRIALLKLEIGGIKHDWKMGIRLSSESRIEVSNEETKRAVAATK